MHRTLAASALALALLAAPTALAGQPRKGAVYIGTIESNPFPMRINMGVAANGKTLRFTYECGHGSGTYTVPRIPIDATGQFKYAAKNAAWKVAGRFLPGGKAHVSLNSLVCGGSKGSTKVVLKGP